MKNGKMVSSNGGTSKLALLRQKRGIKKSEVDIESAIDGFASSIDGKVLAEEIARNSALVNLIVDCSGTMNGTSYAIAQEVNEFAKRQAYKLYRTMISLALFNEEAHLVLDKVDVKQLIPVSPWECDWGTNIYDALFTAITPILKSVANHRLHLIVTDGLNGGSMHTEKQVQDLIKGISDRGDHVFLLYNNIGHGIGVENYAVELGVKKENAVEFSREGDGIKIIFQTIEDLLDGLRTKGTVPEDWSRAITVHKANPLEVKARQTMYLE